MRWLQGNVRRQLALLLAVFVALFVVNIVYVFSYISQQQSAGRVINQAGRERMLLQKVSKESFAIAAGRDELRPALQETAEEFDEHLTDLVEGNPATGIPAAQGRIRDQLEKIRDDWAPFYERVRVVQAAPVESAEFDVALGYIAENNVPLLTEIDAMVSLHESQFDDKIATLKRVVIGIGITSVVVAAAGALGMYRLFGQAEEGARQLAEANAALRGEIGERERAEGALRQSEERFRALAEYTPDGIVTVDGNGHILMLNDAAEQMFGYPRDELFGQAVEILLPAHLHEAHAQHRAGYYAAARPRAMGAGLELAGRRKDESEFPVDISLTPLNTEEGIVVAAVRDITERRRMEEALRQTVAELERSNRDLEQFAYVASHDLQEPLRMVANYTQLLARRYKGSLDGDADEFIAYAVDGATRMQTLINDLLAFSRVGTRGSDFEATDCQAVLERTLGSLRAAIEESGAEVTHDPLPAVMADAGQLGQVLQNLIGNAIKFRGQEPPRIHVSARRDGDGWTFSVRDNGIGVAPEYHDRIFVIFQRLHGRDEYQGTGIGLAICKKIVERHGGRIWLDSQPGKGTTFYFTLGALPERARQAAMEAERVAA